MTSPFFYRSLFVRHHLPLFVGASAGKKKRKRKKRQARVTKRGRNQGGKEGTKTKSKLQEPGVIFLFFFARSLVNCVPANLSNKAQRRESDEKIKFLKCTKTNQGPRVLQATFDRRTNSPPPSPSHHGEARGAFCRVLKTMHRNFAYKDIPIHDVLLIT